MLETIAHIFHPRRSNNHRSRLLHPEAYVMLIAVTIGFGIFIAASSQINTHVGDILGYASDISVQDVVAQTNQQRARHGVSQLAYNDQLSRAAQAKAEDMFAQQYWAHTSPAGVEPWAFVANAGYSYASAGENLARDFMRTDDMVSAWMASPTHRDNILSDRYNDIGVAVVNGELDGIETTLVVQMFGRPATAARPLTPAVPVAAAQEIAVESSTPVVTDTEADMQLDLSDSDAESSSLPAGQAESVTRAHSQNSLALISPLQLVRAFGVSLTLLLLMTLIYDEYIVRKHRIARLVGKNIAHVLFFATVGIIMVIFRGGFIG